VQADVQTALVTRYCLHTEEWNRTGVTVTAIPPCPAAVCWEEKRCEVPKRVVLALVEEPFDFQTGFTELPMGLVEDLLSQSSKLAEHIRKQIQEMEQVKKEVREQLKREGVLRRDGDLGTMTYLPAAEWTELTLLSVCSLWTSALLPLLRGRYHTALRKKLLVIPHTGGRFGLFHKQSEHVRKRFD